MTTQASVRTKSTYVPNPAAWPQSVETAQRWHPLTLIAFRWCFVYFGLYVLTTQMGPGMLPIPGIQIPDPGTLPPVRNLTLWIGTHLLGISRAIPYDSTGSGDKTFDWVHTFAMAVIAMTVAAIWTSVGRQSRNHERLFTWFRLFVRFALGTTMLTYGWAKAIPLQMPSLTLSRLVEPFGNFSPMGVLWSSIGAAPGYEIFVGLAEIGAGMLLFWPRTATIGALMCLMDTIAIFTLNMTYDVPVKLFSLNLVLMSLFLVAPNMRRLFDLFVLHRISALREEPLFGRSPLVRRNAAIAQVAFGVVVFLLHGYGTTRVWNMYGGGAPKSPLFGIWDVQQMTVDGEVRPPLLTDSTRWRRLIFQSPTGARFQRPNDNTKSYDAVFDTSARTLTLTTTDSAKAKSPLSYQRPSHERLLIDGTLDGHAVHLELAFRDPDSFLQRSRGFRWISEVPFNR